MVDLILHTSAGLEIPLQSGAELPSSIELMPAGPFTLRDRAGEPTKNTGRVSNAQALIARSMARAAGGILPIDFDHGIDDLGTKSGAAAGWITGLHVASGRIMADVEWTAAGIEALEGRTYRFISPVFYMQGGSDEVNHIARAGLTNFPALPELKMLASSEETPPMPDWLKKLADALGLDGETDEVKIAAAAEAAIAEAAQASGLVAAIGLKGPLTETAAMAIRAKITAAASDAEPDPAKFVPVTAVAALTAEIADLRKELNGGVVERVVAEAMEAGKVAPALEAWAKSYAEKDLDGFKAFVASAVPIVNGAPVVSGDLSAAQAGALTEAEKMVCAATGVSEQAFLATKTGTSVPVAKTEG